MKKYLMMALAVVALASCSKSDDVFETGRTVQGDKYANAFTNEFGTVASTVNWGFDKPQTANFDNTGKFTGFTRGVRANGNEWGIYVEVPQPLTQAQKDKVTKFFTETKNPQGIAVNWSDFFVQQVSSTNRGPWMNYLYCGSTEDHTYNFNAGDAGNYSPVCYGLNSSDINDRNYGEKGEDGNYVGDKIEFMVNSSTEYFAFHNSYDSQFYQDNYVIIPGEVIDAAYPESPSVAGMWFVGFDYEHNKTATSETDNDIYPRDFFFNDWIVKITPGIYKNAERVFAEDLIATSLSDVQSSDWDFNDAVFDVYFEKDWSANKNYAIITLRAAGGTLPLTVAGKEVHKMLCQNQNTMINTHATHGSHVDGIAPAIFRVEVSDGTTANDIPVVVNGTTTLISIQGEATQKLCGPTSIQWANEKVNVKTVFSNFVPYVQGNANARTWY